MESLQDFYSCPICLSILVEPVTTKCGHNFCFSCLEQLEENTTNKKCPLCR